MQIYYSAFESHPQVPGYWHKNFALVCEKLRHLINNQQKIEFYVRTSIAHFKAYLETDHKDPEAAAIEKAIGQLQEYADYLSGQNKSGT